MPTGTGGWRSDVPISMPRPLHGHGPRVKDNDSLVNMDGFCFTINGLFHDLSQNDLDDYLAQVTSPLDRTETVRRDLDVR